MRHLFFLLLLHMSLSGSEYVNFTDSRKNKNKTFFLSTPKSGSNVITGCLSAITRKPISWFYYGNEIHNPDSKHRKHISYNRLELNLVSDIPLLYRTHYEYAQLSLVPSISNKLIFATRNPKELLYRSFYLSKSRSENPNKRFIKKFLNNYIKAFKVFEAWCPNTRKIIFYEDFITNDNEILIELLQFMQEPPLFYDDFLINKQDYLTQLLQSYSNQHKHNLGGSSSKHGTKALYYTRNASLEKLSFIDNYLQKKAPKIWDQYLKRFKTVE